MPVPPSGGAAACAKPQWAILPVTVALYNLAVPHVLGVSQDASAIVTLFVSASLAAASVIDERALHAMFVEDPGKGDAEPHAQWLRACNWVLGFPVFGALCRALDLQIGQDGTGATPSALTGTEVAISFMGITYFSVAFSFGCAQQHASSLGTLVAVMVPVFIYFIFLAYVTFCFDSSLLPLIVTTNAGIVLSLPILHARLRGNGSCTSGTATPPAQFGGITGIRCAQRVSGPFIAYSSCLVSSLFLAPRGTVAVLLARMPGHMLERSQDLMALRFNIPLPEVAAASLPSASTLLETEVKLSLVLWLVMAALCVTLALRFVSSCFASGGDPEGEARRAAAARRRLTKLRASSKLFPSPFPNGWYHLCNSEDVPAGRAVAAGTCNKEFAVFRDAEGKVAVLHAFCPHLGTHLGHGGAVVDGAVVCPYHSWTFDADGKCVDIPYCSKKIGEKTHTKAFPCMERLGLVFVWLHADGQEPSYELTYLDEIEAKGMRFVEDIPVQTWQMHIMEPSQNAADPYHFNIVHQWLGARDMHGKGGFLWARHDCKSRLALLGHTELDGRPMPDTVISIDDKMVEMWLFGLIPIPGFIYSHFTSSANFQGPQLGVFRIDTPLFGSCRIILTFTPEAPFEQRCTARVWCTPWFPGFLAAHLGRSAVATANQDRVVWEHKLAVAPRNVVAGDGPFATYGTWLRQFYSASSPTWGDSSLDW